MTISTAVSKAWSYTIPRPTTASNFPEPQIFQAASNGTIEGFYMLGLAGAFTNTAATVVGLKTQNKFGKIAGALAGAATGAALGAAAQSVLGGAVGPAALFGGLCGAYSTLRGNQEARFRDAGAFGLTFGAPFVSGGAKAGLGLASVVAAEVDNEGLRALAGAGLGAATGVAFSLAGVTSMSPLVAGLACGGVGVFGALAGPRLGMVMRNVTEDMGKGMVKEEKGLLSRTIGVVPMSAAKQGVMAALFGKFDLGSIAIGFALDASLSAYEIYLNAQNRGPAETAKARAEKRFGKIPGAQIGVITSPGSSGKPVVVLRHAEAAPESRKVQVHFHGDQLYDANVGYEDKIGPTIERGWGKSKDTIFLLPEAANESAAPRADWNNIKDIGQIVKDAVGPEKHHVTVSGHSSGGSPVAKALARSLERFDRVELYDAAVSSQHNPVSDAERQRVQKWCQANAGKIVLVPGSMGSSWLTYVDKSRHTEKANDHWSPLWQSLGQFREPK